MTRKNKKLRVKKKYAVVGEGLTEWFYFNGMKQVENFNFDLKPDMPKHSDINSIFLKAESLLEKGYDKVFCVIDCDKFHSEKTTRARYEKYRKQNAKITFIENMPCIEFWFWLHFIKSYSDKIFIDDKAITKELRKFIKSYEKKEGFFRKTNLYEFLKADNKLKRALAHSKSSWKRKSGSSNALFSFSRMHVLFKEFQVE